MHFNYKNIIRHKLRLLVLLMLLLPNLVYAEDQLTKKKATVGVYLSSLYDLDMNAGSYSADFWIWSKSQIKDQFSLDKVELGSLHGKFMVDVSLRYQENMDSNISFENRKIRGTFLHDFNLDLFPFDRQVLRFYIEGTDSKEELVFSPSSDVGFNHLIQVPGWQISAFRLIESEISHGTNFGYPNYSPHVKYPLIIAEIELVRNSPYLFLKISIGLFVAVLIATLSSAMPVASDNLFGSRVTLIGGALLAAVLNQQFVDSKAGAINSITLIDSIHLIGISLIGLLFMTTIIFRYYCAEERYRTIIEKIDPIFGILILSFFIFGSTLLIMIKIQII